MSDASSATGNSQFGLALISADLAGCAHPAPAACVKYCGWVGERGVDCPLARRESSRTMTRSAHTRAQSDITRTSY